MYWPLIVCHRGNKLFLHREDGTNVFHIFPNNTYSFTVSEAKQAIAKAEFIIAELKREDEIAEQLLA